MGHGVLVSVLYIPSVIRGQIFLISGYCKDPQNELRFLEPHMFLKRLIIC